MTQAEQFLVSRGLVLADMSDQRMWSAWAWGGGEQQLKRLRAWDEDLRVRDEFIGSFGFAVLTDAVIDAVRSLTPILEVGAGSGYWTYELQKIGLDIIATDPGTGRYRFYRSSIEESWHASWCQIERLEGSEAVRRYPDRTLLIVWPDYNMPWAVDTLRAYAGRRVIYVGEGEGGCTADAAFHDTLETDFQLTVEIDIPQFFGLHDRVMIYARTPREG